MTSFVQEIKAAAALVPDQDRRFRMYAAADYLAGRLHILAGEGSRANMVEANAARAAAARIMRESDPWGLDSGAVV